MDALLAFMPKPKPNSNSWIGAAFGAAGRFSRRMRDEWRAGKSEAGQPLETVIEKSPVGEQWWNVLQIKSSASRDEIRQAWRRLMKENHPDKGGHLSPEMQLVMEQATKRINDAYAAATSMPK